eukprot:TRINITY_DN3529_c0_g1_i7.p1 TRINITY_DN3529_c0_g1~~TRINITY_DN3529_c0_g1_i7.p1  ORF type:complete len:239 (-),score=70.83 TRINITY_DN3529_c0_g1_i7:809-1525(-)
MSWLFGKKKTPAEILRENKRMLDKAIRELDRERVGLQNQEKKLVSEIKTAARQGQMGAVQVMAKSLVRNRHAVTKMYGLKSQLQAVSLRMATLKSTQAMADSMQGATKAMKAMNKKLNLPALQQIMRQFEMQNEKMEMTSEMMGDAIDDAFEEEDEEDESMDLVNQVLDEIGINANASLAAVPAGGVSVAAPEAPQRVAEAAAAGGGGAGAGGTPPPPPAGNEIDADLQARLDNLRKS